MLIRLYKYELIINKTVQMFSKLFSIYNNEHYFHTAIPIWVNFLSFQ